MLPKKKEDNTLALAEGDTTGTIFQSTEVGPPLLLRWGEGGRNHAFPRSTAGIVVGLLKCKTSGPPKKGALPPPFPLEGSVIHTSIQGCPCHIAPAAWIQDMELTLYVSIFSSTMPQLRGGQQLCLEGLNMVIRQFTDLLGLGLVPMADSPGPGLLDIPLLCLLIINREGRMVEGSSLCQAHHSS
jgi:hypothetical protein